MLMVKIGKHLNFNFHSMISYYKIELFYYPNENYFPNDYELLLVHYKYLIVSLSMPAPKSIIFPPFLSRLISIYIFLINRMI